MINIFLICMICATKFESQMTVIKTLNHRRQSGNTQTNHSLIPHSKKPTQSGKLLIRFITDRLSDYHLNCLPSHITPFFHKATSDRTQHSTEQMILGTLRFFCCNHCPLTALFWLWTYWGRIWKMQMNVACIVSGTSKVGPISCSV